MPKISNDSLLFQTNEVTAVLFSSPLLTDVLQHICSSLGERWLKFWLSVLVFYFCFHDSCFRAYGQGNICIQNFGSNDRTQCVSPLSYFSPSPSPSPFCACHAGYFFNMFPRDFHFRNNVFLQSLTFVYVRKREIPYRKPIISFFFGRKREDTIRQPDWFFRVPVAPTA